MKVALVQETVDSSRGGAETSTLEMARHLARLGLDVHILCSGSQTESFVQDKVTFRPIAASGLIRALRTYRFVQGVHRLCRSERFDIVHAVTPCLTANIYQPRGGTYVETVQRNLALVSSPALCQIKRLGRRFNIRQRFLMRVEQTLLNKRRQRVHVAAVSDYVRRQVVDGYGFPAEQTRIIFNGVEIEPLTAEEMGQERADLRRLLSIDPEAPVILFVAHNFKLKGLAELLRTVPSDPTWNLVVSGRDRPDRYHRLARRLGIAERVHFVGTETPIRHWYAAADVLAHPTWYDPCSRVALEALSLGLPVITTRFNGACEVMESGRHGEVIDSPADSHALANAIVRALRSEVRKACRADAARLHQHLSMARHARQLKEFYIEIIKGACARG